MKKKLTTFLQSIYNVNHKATQGRLFIPYCLIKPKIKIVQNYKDATLHIFFFFSNLKKKKKELTKTCTSKIVFAYIYTILSFWLMPATSICCFLYSNNDKIQTHTSINKTSF